MAMTVEVASLDDIEEIMNVINDAYQIESNEGPFGFKNGSRFESVNDSVLVNGCKDGRFFKVLEDNIIVGVVYWEQISDNTLYFGPFAVSPNHQKKGIGKLLLQNIERVAREKNLRELSLTVVNHRTDLIGWYQSLGYSIVREEPFPITHDHYLRKPTFFYIMTRSLFDDPSSPSTSSTINSTINSPEIILRGGCHCQSVRYHITSHPSSVCYCHCSICRKITGTLVVPWLTVTSTNLHITGKEFLTTYQSSPNFCRQFCFKCGTQLFFYNSKSSCCEIFDIDVTCGTIDESDHSKVAPTHHIWYQSKDSIDYSEDLPKYQERKIRE